MTARLPSISAMRPLHAATLLLAASALAPARPDESAPVSSAAFEKRVEDLEHRFDRLQKSIDDVLWFERVGDVAWIDKVFIVGPPPARVENPTAMGADNPLKFWTYLFIPRQLDRTKQHPLLVLPHGGVHADFTTYHTHIIREMMAQGYVVVAPEYRGSTGYGKAFHDQIDYGGREVEDTNAARDWAVENCSYIDATRVGIVGWSHGGLIALLEITARPDDYAVAFAGVPVSDLVQRMGYATDGYRRLFSAPNHIGKTAREDIAEYRRRSPVSHVDKLRTPLLIHTTTNDDDVHVIEVEHLIAALKAAGKEFSHEIFQDAPGGHSFDRIDTRLAQETRLKIYRFLEPHLRPATPFRSLADLQKAAYR
jgi:dipeptidyl aminopeptidase/acylaminoacyl peptidase